jgi:carboxyl-terminal processing protease
MVRPDDRKSPFKGLPPAVIAAVVLSLFVALYPRDLKFRSIAIPRKSVPTQNVSGPNVVSEASAAILLDSIVSLVQNYYVDSERVAGEQLVAGTMRSLAYAIPEMRFEDTEQSYSLSGRSEKIEFNHGADLAYEEVLGRLKSVIGFCDRINISTLMDQSDNIMLGAERDSTTIVLNALLSSLDAHSSLLSSDAYMDLRQGTEGAFGGLGVLVGVRENVLTVLKPLPKSPALRMGVKKNDKILSIDGFNTYGLTLDKLIAHMRGEPGSSAQLLTLRSGEWAPKVTTVRREIIEVDSVEAREYHQDGIHVLRLSVENFASRTSKEIINHIRKFRKKSPMTGLVLDLRGNPGGLLDQAVLVSDIFLDKGIVVTTRGRREEIERASMSYDEGDYPIAVLMDEESASASEIVAGALQDNGRAVVIGQPSFGKGSVQTVFELPEQRALKLTIARYFTPADKSIQNIGIIPDVWIQPVLQSADNLNLFGPYRYRNEQFLPNHLSAVANASGANSKSRLKGYFLTKERSPDSDSESFDPEMATAITLFKKVSETYGRSLPEGARRSTHWIALAMPEIKDKLSMMSQDAMAWLRSKHKVGWSAQLHHATTSAALALRVKTPPSGLKTVAGGVSDVPWKISNLGTAAAENVSVFIQSPVSGLETKEVLVGTIEPGQSKEGVLKLSTPTSLAAGRHYVNAGIGVDAQALPNAQGEFLIDVDERVPSRIVAKVDFIDGPISAEPKILDPDETGALSVLVSNQGDSDVSDVKLTAVNLGGEQVFIPGSEYSVGRINAGSSKEVRVPITAKGKFESTSISIGVAIRESNSVDSYFTLSEIRTSGALTAARDAVKLSH